VIITIVHSADKIQNLGPKTPKIWIFRILAPNNLNLRDYVGKAENHRGMTSLFSSNFLRLAEKITRKQRGGSEVIQGSTNINWVCEKRVRRIDAPKHD